MESKVDKLTQLFRHIRHSTLRECKGDDRPSKHLLFLSLRILQKIAADIIFQVCLMVLSTFQQHQL